MENNFQPIRDNARFWRQMRRFMHVFCTVKSLESWDYSAMYETLQSTLSRILLKIQWSTLKKWGSPFVIFSPFWWLASVHCRRRCNGWWHESVGYLYGIPNGIALMALVVTFPALFCRKLLLSLVDFFINQVPVERHTRFIAIPPPCLDYFSDTRWSFVRDKIRILLSVTLQL